MLTSVLSRQVRVLESDRMIGKGDDKSIKNDDVMDGTALPPSDLPEKNRWIWILEKVQTAH